MYNIYVFAYIGFVYALYSPIGVIWSNNDQNKHLPLVLLALICVHFVRTVFDSFATLRLRLYSADLPDSVPWVFGKQNEIEWVKRLENDWKISNKNDNEKPRTHQKQILQSVDDGIDCQHGLPIFSQNVQTHIALQIDVGMIDGGLTLHLGRFVWIGRGDCEDEWESSVFVETLLFFSQNQNKPQINFLNQNQAFDDQLQWSIQNGFKRKKAKPRPGRWSIWSWANRLDPKIRSCKSWVRSIR